MRAVRVIAIAGSMACGQGAARDGAATTFATSASATTVDPDTGSSDPSNATSDDGTSESSEGLGSEGESSTEPPSCDDGVHNGDESDVDCGSGCDPCEDGAACVTPLDCLSGTCEANACGPATSCLAIKQGRPDAATDTYTIHPDGGAPIEVVCDMDRYGGGWTLTFSANGVTFDVAHAVPTASPGSVPDLFESSPARYQQYAQHTEEMFVCTTGEGETPNYEVRTFTVAPRFWDQSLDNAEIFLTGIEDTSDASATEFCAQLVWGGCNLDHYGYAVFNSAFGTANWGRWSANTYYGPKGGALDCFANGDQTDNADAWFWHFVR